MADKDPTMDERGRGLFGRRREGGSTPPVVRAGGEQARGPTNLSPNPGESPSALKVAVVKASPESEETSVGQLNLTQIARSAERIMPDSSNPEDVYSNLIIQPYRDGTVVIAKGSCTIDFLDSQGRKTEGDKNYALSYNEPSKIKVRAEDGHIVFYDRSGGRFKFRAFQTKNEQGLELAQRNWIAIDYVDLIPKNSDIGKAVKFLEATRDSIIVRELETGYNVTVFEDRLTVLKPSQLSGDRQFTDRVANIDNNLILDPKAKGVIYYCTTENPKTILKLDTTKDQTVWQTESADIPQEYRNIRNLRLDSTGNFFTFDSNGEFVVLARDSLQEIQKVPKIYGGILGDDGKIRGIDEEGHFVIYNANFQEVAEEADKRRIASIAQGLGADLFRKEAPEASSAKVDSDKFQHLVPAKTGFETQFSEHLQTTATMEDISNIRESLGKLRARLAGQRFPPDQISFITQGIEDAIRTKEQAVALPIVNEGLLALDSKLSGNLTLTLVTEAKGDLAKLRSLEGLVDEGTRAQIRTIESKFSQQSTEFYRKERGVIEKEVNELIAGTRVELDAMTSMADFADWQEFQLPHRIGGLGALAHDYNEMPEMQGKILVARRQLQELSRDYETRFKEQYAKVREKATVLMTERTGLLKVDIDSFMDRLRGRGFKDRAQAETYLNSSEALGVLRTEIEELTRQNPDAAKELDKALKIQIANVMGEIERGGLSTIAETGAQMERFGDTLFPKWEGKVKEKVKRQVDIIFMPDERTKGPGITADKILGDIGIAEINSRGILQKRRIYEGVKNEDEWRLGSVAYRGGDILPSYVTQADYRKIKQDYADWSRGDESSIRKKDNEKRQELHDFYKQRQPIGKRDGSKKEIRAMGWTKSSGDWKDEREVGIDPQWKRKYSTMLADYAKFASENHISLFNRIDRLKNAPETDVANGAGYVPEWASHWTTDEQTERYLEDMAKALRMQLDLQEGLLDLKGHAGSGKDVLIKMFANRINRPYFSIDCSKWTTEFELSEDVMLESKEGASQTVKVPSVVLNAITTPGAVMYFNEISAMPEQAQIFLHGLTDEKRTLTLKTSSGKAIKADKSVLLVSSRNPGYPGTFEPQFATKSRMVGLQVDYPPLFGEKDPNDKNPNPPYSASEALRIARSVDSLADFTYEANPKHNDFVKIWDKNINGIQNDAPDLTPVQGFDLEVILAMVQFANKLREGFILKFEKARASETRGKLLVDQPITGREMRRCAYFLSKMSAEEKTTANPEAVTRSLIERFFLSHIDKKDEREEIKTAMATWTSSKRPAA